MRSSNPALSDNVNPRTGPRSSMYTVCPQCKTRLQLGVRELKEGRGRARCGNCNGVFDALAQLHDDAAALAVPEAIETLEAVAQTLSPLPPQASAVADEPQTVPEIDPATGDQATGDDDPAKPAKSPAESAQGADAPVVESAGLDAEPQPAGPPVSEPAHEQTAGSVADNAAAAGEQTVAPVGDDTAAVQVDEFKAASAVGEEVGRPGWRRLAAVPADRLKAAVPADEPAAASESDEVLPASERVVPDDGAFETGGVDVPDDPPYGEDLEVTTSTANEMRESDLLAAAPPGDVPDTGADPNAVPLVLESDLAARAASVPMPRGYWRAGALFLAAVSLTLLLVFQYVWFHAAEVARVYPGIAPLVERFCTAYGCAQGPARDPDSFHIIAREVRAHPSHASALAFTAAFAHRAPYPQRHPFIKFTLYDVTGYVLAERVFSPLEYLGIAPLAPLERDEVVHIALDMLAPEDVPLSFEIRFL